MANDLKKPIIILGNTRSGTTIVQKVMATHPDIVGWYEPRAIWLYADPGRPHDEFDERDATPKVKRYIRGQFLKYQKRNGNRRVLEKTPVNILKIPFVRAIFPEATYLFIVRNPFSFISSVEYKWQRPVTGRGVIRRLKDTPVSQLHYYVSHYFRQRYYKWVLGRKYMSMWGPRYRGIQEDVRTKDLLTVIARQWSVCSKKAEKDLAQFEGGEVLRLKYEDFVNDPLTELERICAHCGLEMTVDMTTAAKEWVKSDRLEKWRRFNNEDLIRLLPELEQEMARHNYEIPEDMAKRHAAYQEPSQIIKTSSLINQ